MNGYPVIKGASYTLAITPDMVLHNGTTQTTEMVEIGRASCRERV